MEIKWTHYFKNRCIQRYFDIEKAEHIIRYSTERYFDIDSSRQIVVGSVDNRLILIPYEKKDNIITPGTIHEIAIKLTGNRLIFELKTEGL